MQSKPTKSNDTATAGNMEFESVVLSVAQGKMGKAGVAEFLRKHAKKK